MPESPLSIGFDVPFAEAIAAALARGVVLPAVYYHQLQGLARQLAFSIAGIASIEQLQAVRDSLTKALQTGQGFNEWMNEAAVMNLNLPDHRLDNIWRTNLQGNYMRGEWEQFIENKDNRPYLQYDSINDSRTRPSHLAMDGVIRRWDDPLWKTWSPPAGYRSILPSQRVSGNAILALKAFYSGPAVEIIGESGGRFSVTAQHPVLTRRGWVFSDHLKEGDELICYGIPVGGRSQSANLDKNNAPPTIEQVFHSFGIDIRTTVPRAAVDLYGDVQFIDGDVDIVTADRRLMCDIKAECAQFRQQFKLSLANNREFFSAGFSPLVGVFASPRGFCGTGRLERPRFDLSNAIHGDPLLSAGHQDPMFAQVFTNTLFIDMDGLGNLFSRHPGEVHLFDAFWNWLSKFRSRLSNKLEPEKFRSFRFGTLDSGITDVFIGGFDVNPEAGSALAEAFPGKIKLDKIITKRNFYYSGHVYDLETKSGHILPYSGVCNDHYVVSNCRCSLLSLTEAQARARTGTDKEGRGTGLNKQPLNADGSRAEPDKGWDYNPYEDQLKVLLQVLEERKTKAGPVLGAAIAELISAIVSSGDEAM